MAAADDPTVVTGQHDAHGTSRRVPAGRVEHAVRDPRPARTVVGMRRRVVRIVVVAEHPVHERIRATDAETARALIRFAVAHDDVVRMSAGNRHAIGPRPAFRPWLIPPFGNAMRIEPVGALDMVREAAFDKNVSALRRRAGHHHARAGIADDQVTDCQIRSVRNVHAPVVQMAVTADLWPHSLAICADFRPVVRCTCRLEHEFLMEDAAALQEQALAGAKRQIDSPAEGLPGCLRRQTIPGVIARLRVDMIGSHGANRRIPGLRRIVGIRSRHENDSLAGSTKRSGRPIFRVPGGRSARFRILEHLELEEGEAICPRVDGPLERQLAPGRKTGNADCLRRHLHALARPRLHRAGPHLRTNIEQRPLQRGRRSDGWHQFTRPEHAERRDGHLLVSDAEVRDVDLVLRPHNQF